MQQPIDDIHIIREVLQGRQSAFAALVDKYQSYVFTLVLRFVKEREVAEELAQDVFVKAYRCLADFKGESKFSTWLYTIVNTTCLSHLRKKTNELILVEDDRMASLTDDPNSANITSDLHNKARAQALQQAIYHLQDADAQVLELFYLAEQTIAEIGLIMGLTPANVKVKLFRARQKLKEIILNKYSGEITSLIHDY